MTISISLVTLQALLVKFEFFYCVHELYHFRYALFVWLTPNNRDNQSMAGCLLAIIKQDLDRKLTYQKDWILDTDWALSVATN